MKKIISIILAMLMAFSCISVLASCNFGGSGDGESESSDNGAPVEYFDLVSAGKTDYQIVMGESATAAIRTLASVLADAVKEMSDAKIDRVTDKTAKYPVKSKEILIGKTGRSESDQVLSEITEIGWKIKFVGNKLVVAGSNDYMLEQAIRVLTNEILVKDGDNIKIDKNINRAYTDGGTMMSLLNEKGKFKYKVVYSASANKEVRTVATGLVNKLRSLYGDNKIAIGIDSAAETEFEILVGETKRQQSKALYESIGMLDMKSCVDGTKIVIGAASATNLDTAVNHFYNNMLNFYKGTYDGKYALQLDYVDDRATIDYMTGVPMLEVGNYKGEDDVGDGTHVFVWDSISSAQYNAYKAELEAVMTKENEYEMAGNKYTLLRGERATVYLTYLPSQSQARLFVEKTGNNVYPPKEQASYTTVSGYKPMFYMFDVDSKNGGGTDETTNTVSGANGGMGFAMKLADGSFVLIDGGYDTEGESEKILKFLKDNTPEGQTPVVSAWFITHQHGDHYGALANLTRNHVNEFKVKAFYCNLPSEGHSSAAASLSGAILGAMSKWSGAVIYDKIHSGMTFYVVDAKFEVIFTHEDIYPRTESNVNDTSMAFRITHGGKKIMILGDIEDVASITIETNFKNADVLKSDIVQYSHHGYEGANMALYNMIQAPTVLWPVNTYSWQLPNAVGKNIFEQMVHGQWWINGTFVKASYIKAIICAEEAHFGAYAIDLMSYTPPKPVKFDNFARSGEIYISNYVDLYNKVKNT